QGALLLLCLVPFALGLVAAAVRAFPYGGCCRLSQHVAPLICLLAGAGAAALIRRAGTPAARRRWTHAALRLFVLVGVAGWLPDVIRPYRSRQDLGMRNIIREVAARCGANDPVIVLNRAEELDVVLWWRLEQFRLKGGEVHWAAAVDADRLRTAGQ